MNKKRSTTGVAKCHLCPLVHVLILVSTLLNASWATRLRNPPDSATSEGDVSEEAFKQYPYLDAIVASGYMNTFRRLSWSDMLAVFDCTVDKDGIEEAVNAVPGVIEKALKKAERDQGRILEYTEETFQLGENYKANVRGTTLACFVIANDLTPTDGSQIGPAASAAHVVASGLEVIPGDSSPRAYNVSMMIEADIVELGATGLLYTPKKYCFDLVDDYDFGINLGGEDVIVGKGKAERNRQIPMGSKTNDLTSFFNRLIWLRMAVDNITKGPGLLRSAYHDAKAELIALADTIETQGGISCHTNQQCMNEAEATFNKYGLELDTYAATTAMIQHSWMADRVAEWRSFKEENYWLLEIENETFGESFFPAPLVFDKSIAAMYKNSLFAAAQVNPYYSQDKLRRVIGVPKNESEKTFFCVLAGETDTSEAKSAAHAWSSALRRRLLEHAGEPQTSLYQWALYDTPLQDMIQIFDAQYLAQNVTWTEHKKLQKGNLTAKVMGLTADWLMVTDYVNSSALFDLLERQQRTDAYARTFSKAVVLENPCADVATNTDIYLLVLGMAVAACGGVNAVVSSLHHMFHWAYEWALPLPGRNRVTSVSGWRRFLPTYELCLVIVGSAVFISLYIPVFLQVQKEVEIAEFSTSEVEIQVDYGESQLQTFGGRPAFITLAHTETTCEDARPGLLIPLVVVGLLLGLMINAPFIGRACGAIMRYFKRLPKGETEVPDDCSIRDTDLRILSPPSRDEGSRQEEATPMLVADTAEPKDLGDRNNGPNGHNAVAASKRTRKSKTQGPQQTTNATSMNFDCGDTASVE